MKKSQTVLITGASSGIGKACAHLFAKKGWNVAATMRTPEKEDELAILQNVKCIKLDVTRQDTITASIQKTLETFGQIDAIVNNAGFGLVGPFESSTNEQIEKEFETNVFGMMYLTREILPYFRKQRSGVIVNVSSMGGKIAFPLYSIYHATKWAIEGFSESLQHELVPFNIKVKIIEPGTIKTEFYSKSQIIMEKDGLEAYNQYVQKALPYMLRSGLKGSSPKVVAKTVYKACTDNCWQLRYPTGKNAQLALTMRRILPDSIYTKAIRKMVLR